MNIGTMKRILAFCVAVILLPAGSLAASSDIFRLLTDSQDGPVTIRISAPRIISLAQFDEKRTEQANALLKHLCMEMTMDESRSSTVFRADDEELFTVCGTEEQDAVLNAYSFDPGIVYRNRKNTDDHSDHLEGFLDNVFFRIGRLADSLYPLFCRFPEQFPELSREEKVSINLSGYGKAVSRVTVTFPADYVQEHFPGVISSMAETAECGSFLQGLTFTGSQKVILLFDQDQRLIRVSYGGNAGTSPETLRNVSLVWKCARTDSDARDHFQIKTPAIKGYDRNNATYSRTMELSDPENRKLAWDIQIDEKTGEERRQVHFSAEASSAAGTTSVKAEYTARSRSQTKRTNVISSLQEEKTGEYTGTLEITDYSGKIVKSSFTVQLDISGGEAIPPVSVETDRIIDLDAGKGKASGEQLEYRMSQAVIQGILKLPQEDLLFLSDGLPEEVWSDIVQ